MKESASQEQTIRTTCPYCGVGCGVAVTMFGGIPVTLRGDSQHPANFGRLCSKGSALLETLDDQYRLLQPKINGHLVTWSQATDHIADIFSRITREHGAESVAFYVSGQLLTEDYYVINKFVKGYLGTGNIDTNSRLCMASSVAGHKRAFGSDMVPVHYQDLEMADLVVLTGSNLAWCHPVLFQRLSAAKERNPSLRVILIDPRNTATATLADDHLAIASGTDRYLFGGLLNYLAVDNRLNHRFLNQHTDGLEEALCAVSHLTISEVARRTGIPATDIRILYTAFAECEKVVTVYSQGVNQSRAGTDTVNSIINCHLATGRIGREGAGPFSVTGQPNAMGGREVGGLANMLAAHMDIENPEHREIVQKFWRSPRIVTAAGPKAVDLFKAVAAGKIKALWVLGTNPADSLPEANLVQTALKKIPHLIVSDVVAQTDTLRYASVQLPALAWGEKSGTVTNSERRISRQRTLRRAPGEARPDWWAVAQVAVKLGFGAAFDYTSSAAIFREHAALSGTDNAGSRDFDISGHSDISDNAYDLLEPFQWPFLPARQYAAATKASARPFSDGRFYTSNHRAQFVPLQGEDPPPLSTDYPLRLNTGRIRDQWHTMTRTGYSARLSGHYPEPFVEINPNDAYACNIEPADLVNVSSVHGCVTLRASLTQAQPAGSVFVPIHWSDQFASNARVDSVIGAVTDPISGQPASKCQPVNVGRCLAACYGFAVTRCRQTPRPDLYWASAICPSGWRTEFASIDPPRLVIDSWHASVDEALGDSVTKISYVDHANEQYRLAVFAGKRLQALVFLAASPVRVARQSMVAALQNEFATSGERRQLLSACSPVDVPDPGTIICSCNNVGSIQILDAINRGSNSLESLGEKLSAGTNCGSCRSELSELIERSKVVPRSLRVSKVVC